MDNFAFEQDWTIHCNIPSRRWKIRRIRTARDKKLRQLEKDSRRLWNEIRALGYEPLEPPIIQLDIENPGKGYRHFLKKRYIKQFFLYLTSLNFERF